MSVPFFLSYFLEVWQKSPKELKTSIAAITNVWNSRLITRGNERSSKCHRLFFFFISFLFLNWVCQFRCFDFWCNTAWVPVNQLYNFYKNKVVKLFFFFPHKMSFSLFLKHHLDYNLLQGRGNKFRIFLTIPELLEFYSAHRT